MKINLGVLQEFIKEANQLQRNKEYSFNFDEFSFENLLKFFYLYHLQDNGYLIKVTANFDKNFIAADVNNPFDLKEKISQTFAYFLGELLDNVKEHSHTNRAYIFHNINDNEILGVFDAGISIQIRYKEVGIQFTEPKEAIKMAISGISAKTKEERGYGLSSIIKITQALNGEFLLISGEGIFYLNNNENFIDNLSFFWPGTSVIIKSIKPKENFNFLEFIK